MSDNETPENMIGLNLPFQHVRQFHDYFGHPAPEAPVLQPLARAKRRADWIDEEAQELRDAGSIKDQADAYIDVIYFALGGLVELGIEPQKLFDIVHRANMGKMHIDDNGRPYVRRREDGKIIKPPNWERDFAPDIRLETEIERQQNERPLEGGKA